jgi:lysophospholipase L1-like esterase
LEQHLLPLGVALVSFALVSCGPRPSAAPLAESPASSDAAPAPVAAEGASEELVPASDAGGTEDAATERREQSNAKTNPNAPAPDPASYGFPKDTLILHVGDSFAGSLGVPLGKRFKAAGMRTVLEFETASYVPTWASGKELPRYIDKYRPSLVIVTLGANEVEVTNPEQRAGAVKRLVGKLGGRPCVWVIPPLWKPDTGIFKVIRENAAPCRILESDEIVHDLTRQKDNIHPNDPAREIWADAVLAWLARERVGAPDRPWELRPAP